MSFLPVPTRGGSREISTIMSRDLPKYFTTDEIHRILSNELKDKDYKSWFLCLFLWHTGARVSEAVQVRVADIDLRGRAVRLITLKGIRYKNHTRVVPVPPEFIAEVGLWITQNELKRHDLLFKFNRKTAYFHVKKACRFAGIDDERCHPHTLRHSFAVNCVLQQVPITVLKEWLGHTNVYSTLIYTKVLASDSRRFMDSINW